MTINWFRAVLYRLALLLLLCTLFGLLIDQLAWTLAAGLALHTLWTLRQLLRFQNWLKNHPNELPPDARGVWHDIFDSIYQMQRRDARHRQRLQAVIDRIQSSTAALKDAVVMVDREGHLEWWNHAAERLLGLRAPADSGQTVTNLIRDPRFVSFFEQGAYRETLDIHSPIDANVWLQYAITRYGEGERLMVVRDVTRLHNLEQMRKDFVANVSHELRTPLTVVVGYLETLTDNVDEINPRWKRALLQMQQQGRRMQSLLNDLLLLARLETSDTAAETKPVAVERMLATIRQDAQALSGEQNHRITLEALSDRRLLGVEGELRSAFSNLVFNAVKYTPAGGDIHVRWWVDDNGAHMSVRDNGVGIAPQHISRLTERFYRVDSSRNSNTGGTGLGLAIVKHVLIRHDGELKIHSAVGQGSSFTCHFPLKRLV
ncbi:phosphate regulon sensor histidine kinase PhoR [Halopseudomonas nanhaiensis]|uniref:phosphate regulon sensor histidine kinase PhoR n=1 Tax=Halopseudomonas nanhaiensis TaxID=2830842 RepID=UPI001CBDFABA|nr:phosphate regulon sensor histidine kinase PhoR [Halopseudomonas nanhaiensis]UAW98340.1 phosphate regulon sensor histidine kinase PhoR [Halopseudomonas nanhaiensis]